jgi:ketosteroid isomerase-like protein
MSDQAKTGETTETFNQFVAAINSHNVKMVAALMSPDHLFVDSAGNQVQGAASMEAGWRSYFNMCPDYWIKIEDLVAQPGLALAVGHAGGTIDGIPWRTPAAWKALIGNGMVLEWRVFADNKPVYEILAKRKL